MNSQLQLALKQINLKLLIGMKMSTMCFALRQGGKKKKKCFLFNEVQTTFCPHPTPNIFNTNITLLHANARTHRTWEHMHTSIMHYTS